MIGYSQRRYSIFICYTKQMIMEFALIKVILLLIFFGIILPSFDGYTDIILAYQLLSGTYWTKPYQLTKQWSFQHPYHGPPKKQPIFGTMVLIPIILGTLFTIPHWFKQENTQRKKLETFPFLIFQLWPQYETFSEEVRYFRVCKGNKLFASVENKQTFF